MGNIQAAGLKGSPHNATIVPVGAPIHARIKYQEIRGMNKAEYFLRMFAYDDWANRESLDSLKSANAPMKSARVMSHVISAERLWLERLKQDEQTLAVWPELSLEDCEAQLEDLARLWREFLTAIGADDYSKPVSYTNSKGEQWSTKVEDILTHVLMHSAYHRGQIAFDLRASGQTPSYTDFIHAERQGFLD
jgi:uncharacterized damage-inducible protein DinB